MGHLTRWGLAAWAMAAILGPATMAAAVPVGTLSFELEIPREDPVPGTNHVLLTNLTGAEALPGDFPVLTGLVFQDSVLTLVSAAGASTSIDLGDVGPGFLLDGLTGLPPDALRFPDTESFASMSFTATLSAASFQLAGGATFVADSTTLSATLLPSSGASLLAGDLAVLDVAGRTIQSVPEPSTLLLLAGGLGVAALAGRRRRGPAAV
jgi:hypothetical protein